MKRLLLLIGLGCGTAVGGAQTTSTQTTTEPPQVAEPDPNDDAASAVEEAIRDHRQRYGAPKQSDPQAPMPIDDIGAH